MLACVALSAAMIVGAQAQDRSLVIAATTSVEDSGLFDHILPAFTAKTGIAVRVVSRASATALMTAERGTIDLVIVNDAEALDRFAAAGQGTRRHRFMYNRFVIVGPQADPAGVKGMTDAAAALREIARQRATFVSRGDNSGTHVAEQHLWQVAQDQSEDAHRQLVPRDRPRHGPDGADGGAAQRLHADRPRHLAARRTRRA